MVGEESLRQPSGSEQENLVTVSCGLPDSCPGIHSEHTLGRYTMEDIWQGQLLGMREPVVLKG